MNTLWIVGGIVYVLLAFLVGKFGRDRALGFGGFFVLALLFTPVLIALILAITVPKSTADSPDLR